MWEWAKAHKRSKMWGCFPSSRWHQCQCLGSHFWPHRLSRCLPICCSFISKNIKKDLVATSLGNVYLKSSRISQDDISWTLHSYISGFPGPPKTTWRRRRRMRPFNALALGSTRAVSAILRRPWSRGRCLPRVQRCCESLGDGSTGSTGSEGDWLGWQWGFGTSASSTCGRLHPPESGDVQDIYQPLIFPQCFLACEILRFDLASVSQQSAGLVCPQIWPQGTGCLRSCACTVWWAFEDFTRNSSNKSFSAWGAGRVIIHPTRSNKCLFSSSSTDFVSTRPLILPNV